jgi:hypothetical protein
LDIGSMKLFLTCVLLLSCFALAEEWVWANSRPANKMKGEETNDGVTVKLMYPAGTIHSETGAKGKTSDKFAEEAYSAFHLAGLPMEATAEKGSMMKVTIPKGTIGFNGGVTKESYKHKYGLFIGPYDTAAMYSTIAMSHQGQGMVIKVIKDLNCGIITPGVISDLKEATHGKDCYSPNKECTPKIFDLNCEASQKRCTTDTDYEAWGKLEFGKAFDCWLMLNSKNRNENEIFIPGSKLGEDQKFLEFLFTWDYVNRKKVDAPGKKGKLQP